MLLKGNTRRKEASNMQMIPKSAQAWLVAGVCPVCRGALVAVPEIERFRC